MPQPNQPQPPKCRPTLPFWIGLILCAVGSGPLLVIILLAALGITKDPNPNPVGFGILAMLTFWPGVGLILGGLLAGRSRYQLAQKQFNNPEA
jgi:hypothetical protein